MPVPQQLPPIAEEPLSVVLLAGEAAPVGAVVPAWTQFLDARGRPYELLVSIDGPAPPADMAGDGANVRVLCGDERRGEGAALRRAVAEAKNPLLFYTLCQPEYRPEFLGMLLDRPGSSPGAVKEIDQVHLLTGCRAGAPVPAALRAAGLAWRIFCRVVFSYAPQRLPGWLGWRGWAGRLLARILFGLRYHDVMCPVRLIRRDVFARIPLQSDSRFAHVEVLAKANFLGCLMAEEVPLPIGPNPDCRDAAEVWRDGVQVFHDPDFGPAVLPTPLPSP
jgi:hypothetical protein